MSNTLFSSIVNSIPAFWATGIATAANVLLLTSCRPNSALWIRRDLYIATIWIAWLLCPLSPEASLLEIGRWDVLSPMITRRFVGMSRMEDGKFRLDGTRRRDNMVDMYRINEQNLSQKNSDWYLILNTCRLWTNSCIPLTNSTIVTAMLWTDWHLGGLQRFHWQTCQVPIHIISRYVGWQGCVISRSAKQASRSLVIVRPADTCNHSLEIAVAGVVMQVQ